MLAAVFGVNAYFQLRKRLTTRDDYESTISLFTVADQKNTKSPLNIRQRRRRDSSTTNARPAAPMRSLDVHWRAHVCWRADSASCRSKASLHMSDMSVDGPNVNRS